MLLDGIHIPLTTPFYPDGRLYLRKLEHNVERFCRTPAAGLLVLGPMGEANTLSDAETREALSSAVSAAAAEKVMLAGIARDGVGSVLEHAEYAGLAGYDAVVVGVPAGLEQEQTREAVTFFQAIADRSPLPIVLQSTSARGLPVEVVAKLAGHPAILAAILQGGQPGRIKELRERTAHVRHMATVTTVFAAVTGRMQAKAAAPVTGAANYVGVESLQAGGTALAVASPVTVSTLKTRTRETGFQVLTGSSSGVLQGLRNGANGAVPALAACAPQACYEILAGWKDGDQGLAEEKQDRVLRVTARMEQLGVPGLKYAADLNGYYGGRPRLPRLAVTAAERAEIEGLMRPMRN